MIDRATEIFITVWLFGSPGAKLSAVWSGDLTTIFTPATEVDCSSKPVRIHTQVGLAAV